MIQHLLYLGMDVNALWRREYPPGRRMGRGTPLHAAVSAQAEDRIWCLVERGADVGKQNTLGQTPLEFAVAKGLRDMEPVLKEIEEKAGMRDVH